MILVGSKALQYYVKDLGRVIHDTDLWLSDVEYDTFKSIHINALVKETERFAIFDRYGSIYEVKKYSQLWDTDKEIYTRTLKAGTKSDVFLVPSLSDLFCMKATTVPFINEPKHMHDLELFKKLDFEVDAEFYERRLEETKKYHDKEKEVKYKFFHKYHIPEYIVHDELHDLIASLLDIKIPTYQRITVAETDIAEELFNKLTQEQKISLMVEESLVLALERWFIPQMIENGINYKLIDMFYSNNEASPTYKILKHCCITGLKGEAEYITNFSRQNFFEIEKAWQSCKEVVKSKGGFTQEFYSKLFDLRTKYKNGEKIGTT